MPKSKYDTGANMLPEDVLVVVLEIKSDEKQIKGRDCGCGAHADVEGQHGDFCESDG